MQHPSTAALYAYWNRQRGAAPAPIRRDIAPDQISGLLGDMFILQADEDGAFPFRLAGTRLCAIFGRELTGQDFRSLWSGEERRAMTASLQSVREGTVIVHRLTGFNGRGQTLTAEMILLPLSQDGLAIDRVLGLFAPVERPYWLGLHPLTRQTIVDTARIAPSETKRPRRPVAPRAAKLPSTPPATVPGTIPSPEGDRQAEPSGASEPDGSRRPRLVVFEGGRR
ncbi:PAS domain-containing protein [Kaistia sp. 32K]|uniref:PAS domain-containing protein n=1 Tax=Kaistia sp. 32K TaxID=2795690 RepID=UPI001915937C|nr:PAS domain-containing protein [Kaistia sp. 32K]BCP54198.1 PAS domain-containing protein [Kaistia sp. 32K]